MKGIAKYILTMAMLAGVTATSADPIFNVFSYAHRANTGEYYLCDGEIAGDIRIIAANKDSEDLGNINVEIYANASDVGNASKAVATYTNEDPGDIKYLVERSVINPTNTTTTTQSYYVRITPADGSEGSWIEEITFNAIHIDDITTPTIEPYCAGKMPATVNSFILTHASAGKYHWYDADDNDRPIGLSEFLTVGNLTEGKYTYKIKVKDGNCYSPGAEITLSVMGNSAPHLNRSYVTYTSADITGGKYTKSVVEQAAEQIGKELVDNPNNCDLIWKDQNGTVISDFDNFTPDVPTTSGSTIDQYTVQKDCGCGSVSKAVTLYVLKYIVPKPTVEDKEFCVGDSHAADGFDAIIGLTSDVNESAENYILEFSKNPDMSDAVQLPAGSTHFDFAFDVSEAGTTTYYVRQQEQISGTGEYSEIVSFAVTVKQPSTPVLADQTVCANTTKSVALSSISSESDLIWKDAKDKLISGSVSTEKRGDITVSAQKSELVNGEQCMSEIATATIHIDSLNASISGDKILLPGQTGKVELSVIGSGSQTIRWSSDATNSIKSDASKSDVDVVMGTSNITLTALITDGGCTQSLDWTIQADLFECPSPTADDINLCVDDPRAADGFNANITLANSTENKSDYVLSVSKNADMSDATTLSAGETHFNYTFDVSAIGVQTIYIQQTELSRNLSSAIIPVKINVSQPDIPSLYNASICLNDANEIALSELSSNPNLQWYDEDKNELTTTARFSKKGTHTLYAKQYTLVNGEKCWSEQATISVTADSIGIKVNGDDHLCPGSDGKVSIIGTTAAFVLIQWSSEEPDAISNAMSPTVSVKMGESDLNLNYSVTSGVCKTTGTWEITVGTGKATGKIKFTEGEKIKELESLDNVSFNSCGGIISVEATVDHTSSDFTVWKNGVKSGTYTFVGDDAKFDIEGAGSYSVIYANDCETSFSFKVTGMTIEPTVTTSKWSSCYGGYIAAEITNADGCKVVWKKDGTEIAKDTKELEISNVSTDNIGEYRYELVCDGCPYSDVVSESKPDIYSPLDITIEQSADTICQGDAVDVEIRISPNSDKASYLWVTASDITTSNSGASATLSPFTTKSYNVAISNGDCAKQTKTVNVNVQRQMSGEIEAGSIMCEGDSTVLDASSLEAEKYEWEHTNSDSPIISVVPENVENRYTVTAYRGKCILKKEFTLMVGATPQLASIDSIGLDDVAIIMESTGEYKYIIDGREKAVNVTDNVKKHVGFGSHTLSIVDIAGCKIDTSFTVATPPLEIPIYFTPNSSDEHSTFKIPDAVVVYGNTTMSIYDRWGKKLVTLTTSDTEGWDGTYNGVPMPSADYWYELNVDELDKVFYGHFTLMRE